MFSFRKRPKQSEDSDNDIKASPSLPELHALGIPWPENLVDIAAIREGPSPSRPQQGAVKSSLQSPDRAPIPFHKPFRVHSGNSGDTTSNGGTISSLYMSHPPSAFDNRKATASPYSPVSIRSPLRKNRLPSTFNIMVVGGRGTGKTSLLRLLLETAEISPTATEDQLAVADRFLKSGLKRTTNIDTACVEICESRHDRVLLTVIDTPGLDFSEGCELRVEHQVTGIIRYLDAQFADTMNEESKVVRQSKGDQHVHLCIFMVDPSSIMTTSTRRAQSSLPTRTRSATTISYQPSDSEKEPVISHEEESSELVMSPAEIRVIRRLSNRVNVLPIIARADSLTDDTLSSVKNAVRRALHEAGLDFGVFTSSKPKGEAVTKGNGNGNGQNGHDADEDTSEEERERKSTRTVIKLRGTRVSRSRSRSRRDISADDTEPYCPDDTDQESVANVRFSAHVVAKANINTLLPFALVAPEPSSNSWVKRPRPVSMSSKYSPTSPSDAPTPVPIESHPSHSIRKLPFLAGPPEDLRGVFVRKFRWGTIDVLDPEHCDFAALRTAVLLTHMKILKIQTREVLYEKYRTEKLLFRRATRSVPEEAQRLLENLGSI